MGICFMPKSWRETGEKQNGPQVLTDSYIACIQIVCIQTDLMLYVQSVYANSWLLHIMEILNLKWRMEHWVLLLIWSTQHVYVECGG